MRIANWNSGPFWAVRPGWRQLRPSYRTMRMTGTGCIQNSGTYEIPEGEGGGIPPFLSHHLATIGVLTNACVDPTAAPASFWLLCWVFLGGVKVQSIIGESVWISFVEEYPSASSLTVSPIAVSNTAFLQVAGSRTPSTTHARPPYNNEL